MPTIRGHLPYLELGTPGAVGLHRDHDTVDRSCPARSEVVVHLACVSFVSVGELHTQTRTRTVQPSRWVLICRQHWTVPLTETRISCFFQVCWREAAIDHEHRTGVLTAPFSFYHDESTRLHSGHFG